MPHSLARTFHITVLIMILAALLVPLPATAARPAVERSASAQLVVPAGSPGIGTGVRLVLSPPHEISPRDVPALRTPTGLEEYAQELISRQAAPLLAELDRLQRAGMLAAYTFRPEQLIIDVQTSDPAALSKALQESGLQDRVLYSLDAGQILPQCAAAAPERFRHYLADLDQLRQALRSVEPVAVGLAASAAVSPSPIEIGLRKNDYASAFGGTVAPNRLVKMTLLRGGQLVLSKTTSSAADGTYTFGLEQESCLSNYLYSYILEGDQIIVSDGSATYQTIARGVTVAPLDPFKNTLSGSTTPGRKVLVELHNLNTTSSAGPADCSGNISQTWLTPSSPSGDIVATLNDFNSSAWAIVSSYDDSNNRTFVTSYAYRLWNKDYSYAYVWFKPKTTYKVQIIRGGQAVYSENMLTDDSGWILLDGGPWFFEPGDTLQASGEGETLSLKLDIFFPTGNDLNLVAKKITGKISPGRLVRAERYKSSEASIPLGCGGITCAAGYADGSGNYSLSIPGMLPGDIFDITTYDAQGNQEYGKPMLPSLMADMYNNVVYGRVSTYWYGYDLTVQLKTGAGALLEQHLVSSYYFSEHFSTPLQPGYIIEAGYGSEDLPSDSMVIGDLTARARIGQSVITGSASTGQLFVRMSHFKPESNQTVFTCQAASVSGSYQVSLPQAATSGDSLELVLVQPDGAVTITSAHPLELKVYTDALRGRAETPGATLTLTHTHQGVVLPEVSFSTYDPSTSDFFFSSPTNFDPGDQLAIQTSDDSSAVFTIPDLQGSLDPLANRITGHAGPNQPVLLMLTHWVGYPGYGEETIELPTRSDPAGNFAYSLQGLYWISRCAALSAADHCTALAYTAYTSEAFAIPRGMFSPSDPVDRFEPADNDPSGATILVPGQTHTFHTFQDVDWFTFPITAGTTGAYSFSLMRKGASAQVHAALYRQGQTDPLQEFILDLPGSASPVSINFTEPGVYTLRVTPSDPSAQTACDTYYALDVSSTPWLPHLFLPAVAVGN